jgi:hypothetical protein
MKPEQEIQSVLDASRFAVLATQYQGQPHTSLMAFTPMAGIRYLLVAKYCFVIVSPFFLQLVSINM